MKFKVYDWIGKTITFGGLLLLSSQLKELKSEKKQERDQRKNFYRLYYLKKSLQPKHTIKKVV